MHKLFTIKLPDGSVWGVPVAVIAQHRAAYYAPEFGGDIERSLAQDTGPLFEGNPSEIQDWAVNQMNWSDFAGHHVLVAPAPALDFEEAWMNGDKGFSDFGGLK